jgi:hypothetical protein
VAADLVEIRFASRTRKKHFEMFHQLVLKKRFGIPTEAAANFTPVEIFRNLVYDLAAAVSSLPICVKTFVTVFAHTGFPQQAKVHNCKKVSH